MPLLILAMLVFGEDTDLDESRTSAPTKSGCSTAGDSSSWLWLLSAIILIRERKKTT